jgi:hypothetical protein
MRATPAARAVARGRVLIGEEGRAREDGFDLERPAHWVLVLRIKVVKKR